MSLPLQRFSVMRSRSLDETRDIVSRSYCPHFLNVTGRHSDFEANYHRLSFGSVSFNYLEYGAAVSVDANFNSFYMLELPISGTACIEYGRDRVLSKGSIASLISADRPMRSWWSTDARRLMVQIQKSSVERFVRDLTGQTPKQPLEFKMDMDVGSGALAGLANYVRYVVSEIDRSQSFEKYPLVRSQVERTLMTMLLTMQPHNYTQQLCAAVAPGAPRFIERAYQYIQEHCETDVTMSRLVEVSGVPARTLFAGFRKHKGISPMAALKRCRLECAHRDLLDPHSVETVTSVAYKWGFTHLGNFARDYEQLFGEKPSATLRKTR